jgi:hypothetical protein
MLASRAVARFAAAIRQRIRTHRAAVFGRFPDNDGVAADAMRIRVRPIVPQGGEGTGVPGIPLHLVFLQLAGLAGRVADVGGAADHSANRRGVVTPPFSPPLVRPPALSEASRRKQTPICQTAEAAPTHHVQAAA